MFRWKNIIAALFVFNILMIPSYAFEIEGDMGTITVADLPAFSLEEDIQFNSGGLNAQSGGTFDFLKNYGIQGSGIYGTEIGQQNNFSLGTITAPDLNFTIDKQIDVNTFSRYLTGDSGYQIPQLNLGGDAPKLTDMLNLKGYDGIGKLDLSTYTGGTDFLGKTNNNVWELPDIKLSLSGEKPINYNSIVKSIDQISQLNLGEYNFKLTDELNLRGNNGIGQIDLTNFTGKTNFLGNTNYSVWNLPEIKLSYDNEKPAEINFLGTYLGGSNGYKLPQLNLQYNFQTQDNPLSLQGYNLLGGQGFSGIPNLLSSDGTINLGQLNFTQIDGNAANFVVYNPNIQQQPPIVTGNENTGFTMKPEGLKYYQYYSVGDEDAAVIEENIQKASVKYGIPEEMIRKVIAMESSYNKNAGSYSGAGGLMQLMPETAAEMGVSDRFDIAQNIDGGTKYLKQMYDRYNGDVNLTLAGYNAGPGNVDYYGGVPPFRETQNYIAKYNNLNL